jgi:AcrR family transcriptional regulator
VARARTVTNETLLDTAVELIMLHGPAKLTFAALGQQTGLAPATLVQRFGTKERLLVAVAEHCLTDISQTFEAASPDSSAPLEALTTALSALASSVGSVTAFANGLAFLQMDLTNPKLSQLTRQGEVQMHSQIKILLDAAVAAQELRPCNTHALAMTIQTTYHGALITWAIYQMANIDEWLVQRLEDALRPYRI